MPATAQQGLPLGQKAEEAAAPTAAVGVVRGRVEDADGAAVPGAVLTLRAESGTTRLETQTADDGSFVFPAVPATRYQVVAVREGFASWRGALQVNDAETVSLPEIALKVAAADAALEVRASARDIAAAQLELEEKQRVLGVFPNFYASYTPNTEPLSNGQKFRLAWRFVNDPVALSIAGITAASEQRADAFHGYGRGSQGYAKRFGAAYADGLSSTMLGQAILPALLHQDPRYFVKGTGSVGSRALYAIASMVICKGDNRRWQPNYSNVLGNFAAATVSNAYYPAENRGGSLVVQTALTATALGAVGGLFQEFLLHRMTPGVPDYAATR